MSKKVLIGPAPMRDIEPVYGPTLRAAGFDLVHPARHAQMTEDELIAQLPGCVATMAGSEPYTRRAIEVAAAAGLKVIARAGVGYDGVDVRAATDHGVVVTYAPGTNNDAVAEHAMMLLLALAKNLLAQHAEMKAGKWPRRATRPVRGRTLGIVGLGRTGTSLAKRAAGFGLTVLAADPFLTPAIAAERGATLVPLDDLLTASDFVSLHVPLTPDTRHLISTRTLGAMKPTAFLVNTARGEVVHEPDLFAALSARRIAGAGLDVFETEPPAGSPLLGLDNVILTAHTAGVDLQSRDDMARVPALAIVALFNGEWPEQWVVNPEVRGRWKA